MLGSIKVINYLLVVVISLLWAINGQAQSIEQLQVEGTRLKKEHGKLSAIYLEHQLKLINAYQINDQLELAKELSSTLKNSFKATAKAKGVIPIKEEEVALRKLLLKYQLLNWRLESSLGVLGEDWTSLREVDWFDEAFYLEEDDLMLSLLKEVEIATTTQSNLFFELWNIIYGHYRLEGKEHNSTVHKLWQYLLEKYLEEMEATDDRYIQAAFGAAYFYEKTNQLHHFKKYKTIVEEAWPNYSWKKQEEQLLEAEEISENEDDEEQVLDIHPRFPAPSCEKKEGDLKEIKACADQLFLNYCYQQLFYPVKARERNIEGMSVIGLVVNRRGVITDIRVLRSLRGGIDKESLRVTELMNELPIRWTVGYAGNEKVKVSYNLPLRYQLN